jgi:hypothetical protein
VPSRAVSNALDELATARKYVKKLVNRQVRAEDDRLVLRSTAMAWFNSHRPDVIEASDSKLLLEVDTAYNKILAGSERNTTKKAYLLSMTEAQRALIRLREHLVVARAPRAEAAPDFSPLCSDTNIRSILERRWVECTKCVAAQAHLAAIVMMGGLLEALFVARALRTTNKAALLAAKSAPLDKETGKKVPFDKWMLATYLEVAYEVNWIVRSTRDLAKVLGEYRNYVHPGKEREFGGLGEQDSAVLWSVTKGLVAQLLKTP